MAHSPPGVGITARRILSAGHELSRTDSDDVRKDCVPPRTEQTDRHATDGPNHLELWLTALLQHGIARIISQNGGAKHTRTDMSANLPAANRGPTQPSGCCL